MNVEATVADLFLRNSVLRTRAEVSAPGTIPQSPGLYGWWFRTLPAEMSADGCAMREGAYLLYVGISPSGPATQGRTTSTQSLRERVRAHFSGNANSSTLRKTLGCLLADELALELRRVGAGSRMTFTTGEPRLSAWIAENTLVSWMCHDAPWEVESALIGALDVPLNLRGNESSAFAATLSAARTAAIARARELPVVRSEE